MLDAIQDARARSMYQVHCDDFKPRKQQRLWLEVICRSVPIRTYSSCCVRGKSSTIKSTLVTLYSVFFNSSRVLCPETEHEVFYKFYLVVAQANYRVQRLPKVVKLKFNLQAKSATKCYEHFGLISALVT